MIDSINSEDVDLVVVTGDLVHEPTNELFDIASKDLNKLHHKVVVIPGEYDSCDLWGEYFGDTYKHLQLGGYNLEFLDTSSVGHKFGVGWADCLDRQQLLWLEDKLKLDSYHIIFSHHPFLVDSTKEHQLLRNNLRAVYSGHARVPLKVYFKYSQPMRHFEFGFGTTGLKFHGNSCYLLILVGKNDEIANVPKLLNIKKTAWN